MNFPLAEIDFLVLERDFLGAEIDSRLS